MTDEVAKPDRYRRKPVEVEAYQIGGDADAPEWFSDNVLNGNIYFVNGDAFVETMVGKLKVDRGSYLIKGDDGGFYTCSQEVFNATHEVIASKAGDDGKL